MARGDNLRGPHYRCTVEESLILDLYQLDSIKSEGFKEFVQSTAKGEFIKSVLEFYIRDELKGKVIAIIGQEESGLELRLLYNFVDQRIEETIPVSYQRLISGGLKYYLHCPQCNRRITKLYVNSNTKRFLCRNCGDLTYDSCKESEHVGKCHYMLAGKGYLSAAEVKRGLNLFRRKRRIVNLPYLIEIPIKKGKNMHAISLKLGNTQNKVLKDLSKKMDIPKSELIRRAVDMYLEKEIDKELKEKRLSNIESS